MQNLSKTERFQKQLLENICNKQVRACSGGFNGNFKCQHENKLLIGSIDSLFNRIF